LGAIFRLYEARRNGIWSQPPLFATKSSALSPATIEEPRVCWGKSGSCCCDGILPPRRRFGPESLSISTEAEPHPQMYLSI